MQSIESGRITRRYTQQIAAPPDRVFPLLCPVREAEWLAGWSDEVEMIHSDSGLAEDGCVFRTRVPGRPDTVWMITRHDSAAGRVEFVRVTTGLVATRLTIQVAAAAESSSTVEVTYTFTPLGDAGREFVRSNFSESAFERDLSWWEESMNHWLESGEMLRPATV